MVYDRKPTGSSGRVRTPYTPPPPSIRSDVYLRLNFLHQEDRISLFNWLIFNFHGYSNMQLFLGTLIWSVRLCSQSSISRADGDQRSQIKKHVVVSVRSNLPQKSLTVLSEPKFGPPPPIPIKNSWILSWDQLQQERVSSLGCWRF